MARAERIVLHVDMDAYFASVEQALNPRYRGRPVMVCGDPDRRSVVAAASYEARAFGVRAGMPVGEARRRCPAGVFVEGNPERYVYYSIRLQQLLEEVTPLVEPYSIDEAFLELAPSGSPVRLARELKERIRLLCGPEGGPMPSSIGIAPNKLVAKMASTLSKPDGLTVLDTAGFQRIFWPRPVSDMWGIGEKSERALALVGVRTIGDLARCPLHTLRGLFGVAAPALVGMAHGRDDTPVVPRALAPEPKSMGHEYTLGEDTRDRDVLRGHLARLSSMVARRLRLAGKAGARVTIKLRSSSFVTITRQHHFAFPTDDARRIDAEACRLLHAALGAEPVRLLGLSVSDLVDARATTPALFGDERGPKLTAVLDALRDRFGEDVITTGDVLALPPATRGVIPPGDPRREAARRHLGL